MALRTRHPLKCILGGGSGVRPLVFSGLWGRPSFPRDTPNAEGGSGHLCVGGKRGSTGDAVSGRGVWRGEASCTGGAVLHLPKGFWIKLWLFEQQPPSADGGDGGSRKAATGESACGGRGGNLGSFCAEGTETGSPVGPTETPRAARVAQRRFVLIETKKKN